MNVSLAYANGAGTTTAGLGFSGSNPSGKLTTTEEWDGTGFITKTITTTTD